MTRARASKPAGIEVRGLFKSFGEHQVLKGIDLAIEPGEFLVLVGPSGCGKTTLLRCIAGLEEITQGELLIGGKRSNDVHPKDRDLAMVFQSYALYPHMTVAQNLAFSLTVRKMKQDEIEHRMKDAASRLGLGELLERLPRQLSGGQRQRVALGRAIVRQPRAFLFDEPLSNLDAALRSQMRVELKRVHVELGATMIYVTHDQVEAMTLADRIAVLENGSCRQVGSPTELFTRPLDTFVASFIGSPPMSFFSAAIDRAQGHVVGAGFSLPIPGALGEVKAQGELLAGIRPTGFTLAGPETAHAILASVEVVETIGYESHVHVKIGGKPAIVQLPTSVAVRMTEGDELRLAVGPGELHLFSADTGKALVEPQREAEV